MTGAETITNSAGSARTVTAQYSVTSNQDATNAIVIDAAHANGGIDMDCGTGGFNLLSTGGAVSVTGQSGATIATSAAASNVAISAAGGGAQTLTLNSAGTGANALDFNATAGGLDVDVALGVDIQAGSGAININTTSGGAINIGTVPANVVIQLGSIATAGTSTVKVNNLEVSGGLSTTGNTTQNGDLTVAGNLTVQGDTVTMNTGEIISEDKNIMLNTGTSATSTDAGAVGGGITLNGDTDKTFIWSNVNTNSTNDSWDLSEDCNIANGKYFTINKKRALTQTSLYIDTGNDTAADDFKDNEPALYLNQATPMTNAANEWRVKIDGAGDVVFQKRTASANGWQNKFRIQ